MSAFVVGYVFARGIDVAFGPLENRRDAAAVVVVMLCTWLILEAFT